MTPSAALQARAPVSLSQGRQRRQQLAAPPRWCPQHQARRLIVGLHKVAAGMHVPSESFGGQSPERRAAQSLQTFLTFVAARIVLSQLEGIGRGDLGAYNAEGCRTLRHFLQNESMRDCNAWLAKLMKEDELLGVRIMEVRKAYAAEDFEWHNLQRLALEGLEADNTRLLREHAAQRFGTLLEQVGSGGGEQAGPQGQQDQ